MELHAKNTNVTLSFVDLSILARGANGKSKRESWEGDIKESRTD